jgi:hypothetical protein
MSKQIKPVRRSPSHKQNFSAVAEVFKRVHPLDSVDTALLDKLTSDDRMDKVWQLASTGNTKTHMLLREIIKARRMSADPKELHNVKLDMIKHYATLEKNTQILRDFFTSDLLPNAPRFNNNRDELLKSLEWAQRYCINRSISKFTFMRRI